MILAPETRTAQVGLVLQRPRIICPSVTGDPVINTLTCHVQSVGHLGQGSPTTDLQNCQRAPIEAGILGFLQLLSQGAAAATKSVSVLPLYGSFLTILRGQPSECQNVKMILRTCLAWIRKSCGKASPSTRNSIPSISESASLADRGKASTGRK